MKSFHPGKYAAIKPEERPQLPRYGPLKPPPSDNTSKADRVNTSIVGASIIGAPVENSDFPELTIEPTPVRADRSERDRLNRICAELETQEREAKARNDAEAARRAREEINQLLNIMRRADEIGEQIRQRQLERDRTPDRGPSPGF